jgi:hypothetical protein
MLYTVSNSKNSRNGAVTSSAPTPDVPDRRSGERLAKERMTFRLPPDLAVALRQVPNQTAFVERSLRASLGQICPLCHGTGEASGVHLTVSDLKSLKIERLDRYAAAQLKALVRLGRALLATRLELEPATESDLAFRLARDEELLLSGHIPYGQAYGQTGLKLSH